MSHKKKEPTRFIKGGMMRVESVCNHLGPNESLRAQLAPHGVSNAENGVLLGRTGRFPLERYLAQIGFVLQFAIGLKLSQGHPRWRYFLAPRRGLRSRTPSPFPSMNSMPLVSRAARIFLTVPSRPPN
jgi:hypothetical protein